MQYKTSTVFIVVLFFSFSTFSCGDIKKEEVHSEQDSLPVNPNETTTAPAFNTNNIEVRTFEVKDTVSGKSLGWGYDLFIDGHKTIHQPIIPGISGNKPFFTEEEAKITGNLAASKMKQNGGLPTITIAELDSLNVTK